MKEKIKKICGFIACLALMIALSGCVKYELKMGVNDDKSLDFEIIYAIDGAYMDGLDTDTDTDTDDEPTTTTDDDDDSSVSTEQYSFLKNKGYNVEEYTNNDNGHKYAGVKIKKTFKSIDDVTKETEKTIDINNNFFKEDTFDDSQLFSKKGNVYKASLLFDMSGEGSTSTEDTSSYDSMFDMTYTVTLPVKVKESNATKVSEDGKTLTWTLKYGKKNIVTYSFDMSSIQSDSKKDDNKDNKEEDKKESKESDKKDENSNLTLYIVIGCSAGAVVIVLIILIIVLGKKNKQTPVNYAQPTIQPQMNNNEQPTNDDQNNNNVQQ